MCWSGPRRKPRATGAVLKQCALQGTFNSMNPDFTEMGAAYAVDPQRDAASYWTQAFGAPQQAG